MIRKSFLGLTAVISLLALTLIAAQPGQKTPADGFLAGLKKGQSVSVKDTGTCFEITLIPDQPGPLGFEVVEVGNDFVDVRDITGTRQVRIPVYAIKAITTLRVSGK